MTAKSIITLLVLASSVASAEMPFSAEWNWEQNRLNGAVREIVVVNKNGRTVESFNKQGQKFLKETFDKDGNRDYRTIIKYNPVGHINEVWFSNKHSDEPMYVETASFDSNGNVESIKVNRGGKLSETETVTYDENGLSSISAVAGRKTITWTFKFSNKGTLTESAVRYDADVKYEAKYKYDDRGNATQVLGSRKGVPLATATIEYVYDTKSNWVKKTSTLVAYSDGEAREPRTHIEERTIAYY